MAGLFLAQSGDYLGAMTPDALRTLASTAVALSAEHFQPAQSIWAAFRAPTPEALAAEAVKPNPSHPYLPKALQRMLQELPAVASGLNLIQERVLSALREGPRTIGMLFQITQEQEDARFLGDLAFFRLLDRMVFATTPLISGLPFQSTQPAYPGGAPDFYTFAQTTVQITDAGRAALAGRFDHATENAIDRWLGGTHLTPTSLWRRDREGRLAA